MKPPRGIVVVSPGGMARGGGIGSVTRAMVGWLAQAAPATQVAVIDSHGLARFLVAAARLIWLRLIGADVLHLQVSEGGSFLRKGMLLRLGLLLGMRTILHHHGARLVPFLANSHGPVLWFVRRTLALAHCNLVLGEEVRQSLLGLGVEAERIFVLPNAVPDPGERQPGTKPLHFLLPAVLSRRKGIDCFLRAFAEVTSRHPDATATVAGEGDTRPYRQLAEQLGIDRHVRFAGWVDWSELRNLHDRSRALVLPSFEEGLPMAIIEALATGLPVIATPVGAIPEVLRDGETALLVPPGDVAALAAAMLRLAADPQLADALAGAGRQLYERAFTLDRYMLRLLALYGGDAPGAAFEPERHDEIGHYRGAAAP